MNGIPDCVPVFAQMHRFTIDQFGLNARQVYTTPELLVPASLQMAESYEMDIGCIDYDVYNIEAEAIGQTVLYFDEQLPEFVHSTKYTKTTNGLWY